jgi:hypothetical protein
VNAEPCTPFIEVPLTSGYLTTDYMVLQKHLELKRKLFAFDSAMSGSRTSY